MPVGLRARWTAHHPSSSTRLSNSRDQQQFSRARTAINPAAIHHSNGFWSKTNSLDTCGEGMIEDSCCRCEGQQEVLAEADHGAASERLFRFQQTPRLDARSPTEQQRALQAKENQRQLEARWPLAPHGVLQSLEMNTVQSH